MGLTEIVDFRGNRVNAKLRGMIPRQQRPAAEPLQVLCRSNGGTFPHELPAWRRRLYQYRSAM
jgi:hypothetical protein